ncbi:uncharacterized protein [Oscarella lobularis]|uniref:uncharacterized protein n=1 Tax=Oscarella lobularis TaxID=121494 RepID=UPI003313D40C
MEFYRRPVQAPPEEEPFKVFIHNGELAQIRQWVMLHKDIETGGDLFGLWSKEGRASVQFVLGPGKGSRRTPVSFFQSSDYLKEAGSLLAERHGLCHIGEWHSHHQLGLAEPSRGDRQTVKNNMPIYGWKKFIVFIANIPDRFGAPKDSAGIGCFVFETQKATNRIKMKRGEFQIIPHQSPLRSFVSFSEVLKEGVCKNAERLNESEEIDVQRVSDSRRVESIPVGTFLLVPLLSRRATLSYENEQKRPIARSGTFGGASHRNAYRDHQQKEVKQHANVYMGDQKESVSDDRPPNSSESALWSLSIWTGIQEATRKFLKKVTTHFQGSLAREPDAVSILFTYRVPVPDAFDRSGCHVESACKLMYRQLECPGKDHQEEYSLTAWGSAEPVSFNRKDKNFHEEFTSKVEYAIKNMAQAKIFKLNNFSEKQ